MVIEPMSSNVERKRKTSVGGASVGGVLAGARTSNVPKLPPIQEPSPMTRTNDVNNWLQSQQPSPSNVPARRLSTVSKSGGEAGEKDAGVLQRTNMSPITELQSASRVFSYRAPSTGSSFLRPDFRRGYVFSYSLIVGSVLQRYSRFLEANATETSGAAVYEQNPAEVWLADVQRLHDDKLFMQDSKAKERRYLEKRAAELGSRSTDTFMTQRKNGRQRRLSAATTSSKTSSMSPQRTVVKRVTASVKKT